MLTLIICAPDTATAKKQMNNAPIEIEAFEWRVDFLDHLDFVSITDTCQRIKKPIILTLRRTQDGGQFCGSQADHRWCLLLLAQCHPTYLDIESDYPEALLVSAAKHCFIIRSHHNFNQTPEDLSGLISTLQHPAVCIVKLVTQAQNTLDSLRMLTCLQTQPAGTVAGHCMGEDGLPSRFLSKIFGSAISYTQRDDQNNVLPHLPTVRDYLCHRHPHLKTDTKIYGLIGDPVRHSQGAAFHNHCFQTERVNAVYVRMRITQEQLPAFFSYAKSLGIQGLSVTMPLKHAVILLIDHPEPDQRALNTLVFNATSSGINTDGAGALAALKKSVAVTNKTVLILGAGGSAAGLLPVLIQEHPRAVLMYNRTQSKVTALAQHYPIQLHDQNDLQHNQYDIIINTLPIDAQNKQTELIESLIQAQNSSITVMDIVYAPKVTPLLKAALRIGARCVYGEDMFIEQAKRQQIYWGTFEEPGLDLINAPRRNT